MTQQDRWNEQYAQVFDYIRQQRRQPSKHHLEEHRMLNWLKHNRRLLRQGLLAPDREQRLQELLAFARRFRKVNQHAYLASDDTAQEAGLFDACVEMDN